MSENKKETFLETLFQLLRTQIEMCTSFSNLIDSSVFDETKFLPQMKKETKCKQELLQHLEDRYARLSFVSNLYVQFTRQVLLLMIETIKTKINSIDVTTHIFTWHQEEGKNEMPDKENVCIADKENGSIRSVNDEEYARFEKEWKNCFEKKE